jgi:hypothetical protein
MQFLCRTGKIVIFIQVTAAVTKSKLQRYIYRPSLLPGDQSADSLIKQQGLHERLPSTNTTQTQGAIQSTETCIPSVPRDRLAGCAHMPVPPPPPPCQPSHFIIDLSLGCCGIRAMQHRHRDGESARGARRHGRSLRCSFDRGRCRDSCTC